jgi:hypothetical protein
MVAPLWPPITGTLILVGSASPPRACAANVDARTTSKVVTPKRRAGSKTPAVRKVSAATGTVEFTGLVMIHEMAFGQVFATWVKMPLMIEALV